MKEVKFGLKVSNKGMEFYGSDEINELIENGWIVQSIEPAQALVQENPEGNTSKSESFIFAGYEMIAKIEHPKFTEHYRKGCDLSEGLIALDRKNENKTGFFERKKLNQAIVHFQSALVLDPTNAAAYLFKAKCHEALNEFDESVKALEVALELEPHSNILYIETGATLIKQIKYSQAVKIMEKGIDFHPDEPRILSNLGLAYLFSGMAEKAIDVYTKLIESEPDYHMNQRFLTLAKRIASGEVPVPKNEDDITRFI